MKVRENVAVWANDKSGALALDRAWPARVAPWIIFVRRPLDKQITARRTFGDVVFLRNLSNDNAWRDGFEYFCKSIIQLMNDIFACLGHSGRNSRQGDYTRLRRRRSPA